MEKEVKQIVEEIKPLGLSPKEACDLAYERLEEATGVTIPKAYAYLDVVVEGLGIKDEKVVLNALEEHFLGEEDFNPDTVCFFMDRYGLWDTKQIWEYIESVVEPEHYYCGTLKDCGYSVWAIAESFREIYGDDDVPLKAADAIASHFYPEKVSLSELTKVLYSEDGLDLSAADVAKVLKALDLNNDLSNEEIAKALYAGNGANLAADDVAIALKDGCGLGASEVALALYSHEGCDFDAKEVAIAMGGAFEHSEIAWALYSEDGLDRPAKYVAKVLYSKDGLDLPAEEVVDALCSEYGPNLSLEDVAKVLHSENGLGLDADMVADAIYLSIYDEKKINGAGHHLQAIGSTIGALCAHDGLGMEIEDAVKALHKAGVAKAGIYETLVAEVDGGMEYSAAEAKKIMDTAFPTPRAPRQRDNGLEL